MKSFISVLAKTTLLIFFIGSFSSCEKEDPNSENLETLDASVKAMNTIKVTSTGMNFHAPDEIPSGWNTFEYTNLNGVPHFFLMVQIPDDKTLDIYEEEITIPFNDWLRELANGNSEAELILPDWFYNKTFNYGGSGIIDPGLTAVTSMNLPAGNYIMECYVKMPEKFGGNFHSYPNPENGNTRMLKQITVTDEKTKDKSPKADIIIAVKDDGFDINKKVSRPGLHTFAVEFKNRQTEFSKPDVHLVRIDGATGEDLAKLNSWMHWFNNLGEENEGLMTPAPAGFTYMGGTQELTLGGTTYFQALLKPGRYALIAEHFPDPMAGGYFYEFSVGREN